MVSTFPLTETTDSAVNYDSSACAVIWWILLVPCISGASWLVVPSTDLKSWSSSSFLGMSISAPWHTASLAKHLTVAPTPSTAPFPWQLAKIIPANGHKSHSKSNCAQQQKGHILFVLGAWSIRPECYVLHLRKFHTNISEDRFQMCPDTHWTMLQIWWYSTEAYRLLRFIVQNHCVETSLSMACTKMDWLYFAVILAVKVFRKIYVYHALIIPDSVFILSESSKLSMHSKPVLVESFHCWKKNIATASVSATFFITLAVTLTSFSWPFCV